MGSYRAITLYSPHLILAITHWSPTWENLFFKLIILFFKKEYNISETNLLFFIILPALQHHQQLYHNQEYPDIGGYTKVFSKQSKKTNLSISLYCKNFLKDKEEPLTVQFCR